jgi:CO/xanthine dehydrogenase Mo-binding subunit/aerobic-type carbon monoxide dehydrogenase small subunit (CoxS/CutS family)
VTASGHNRIQLTVNGEARTLDVAPATTLYEVLAHRLGCREVRYGCGEGVCGACLVLKDGEPIASCMQIGLQANGAAVVTANGLPRCGGVISERYRILIDQLLDRDAFHCGYCGNGFLVAATHLLANSRTLDEATVRRALSGNLCRCSGYFRIVDSVLAAHRGESLLQAERRPDLLEKLIAASPYPTDARGQEALVGGVLWSAWPSASIRAIDTAPAIALPDVVAVLTHRDLPGRNIGGIGVFASDQPVLAADRVRTMSDVVALVAARSQSALRAALQAIRVEYDVERPITTIEDALRGRAIAGRSNVLTQFTQDLGDVDGAFNDADCIVDGCYTCGSADHACIELDGGAAWWEGTTLVIAAATQTPYVSRSAVARALDLPEKQIRIQAPRVGGSFGRHTVPGVEIQLALLAYRTRQPVRLVLSRPEALVHGPKRHAVRGHYRLAIKDRRMTGVEATLYADAGPYVGVTPSIVSVLACEAAGAYEIPNRRIVARGIRTNNPIPVAMRGYGSMQATFGIERIIDDAARQLRLDPIELRRPSLVAQRTDGYGRTAVTSALHATLDEAIARAGPPPAPIPAWRVGRGTAVIHAKFGFNYGMGDRFVASVTVDSGGAFVVGSDVSDAGTGITAFAARRVAERLGLARVPRYEPNARLLVDPTGKLAAVGRAPGWLGVAVFRFLEAVLPGFLKLLILLAPMNPPRYARLIRFIARPANVGYAIVQRIKAWLFPYSKESIVPTISSSRSVYLLGRAALDAADRLRARALEIASEALGVPAEDLTLDAGGVRGRANTGVSCTWGEIAKAAGGELTALGRAGQPPGQFFDPETGNQRGTPDFMDATHICDVAVEPETGRVRILRYVAVHDAGRVFDRGIVEGQIQGGIVMGLAQVVGEHLQLADGVVQADSFLRYLIPTSLDAPDRLEIHVLESRSGLGPEGAKGIGEAGAVGAPAALASALSNALGVSITSIPHSPATLSTLLTRNGGGRPGSGTIPA